MAAFFRLAPGRSEGNFMPSFMIALLYVVCADTTLHVGAANREVRMSVLSKVITWLCG